MYIIFWIILNRSWFKVIILNVAGGDDKFLQCETAAVEAAAVKERVGCNLVHLRGILVSGLFRFLNL